jgi:hypothetical protein
MPDYKRLVSYIYNYENGVKRNNVGYARVEARNGQCKCILHITAPSLNERQLKVYMFKRRDHGIEGILLGTLMIRNGIGEYKGQTETDNIMNSSYSLDDIGGIIIYLSDTKFYATEWDDLPINKEVISSIETNDKKQDEKPEPDMKKPESFNNLPDSTRNEERDKWEDEMTKKYYGTKPETDSQNNSEGPETPDTWEEPEDSEYINMHKPMEFNEISENADVLKENIGEPIREKEENLVAHSNSEANLDEYEKLSDEELDEPDETEDQEEKSLDSAAVQEIEYYKYSDYIKGFHYNDGCKYGEEYKRSINEDHPIAKRLYKDFPRMFPFEDNEIAWCVRLEPQDIGMLPMDAWILGNNSFLLHGYYSYRHLIFARMNHMNGYSYIIGVPGIYHNREKFMAKMFGFENFKCVKNRERKTGEFGYWYLPVLLN